MQGAAITLIESRGHPALYGQDVTQGRPAVGNSRRLELDAEELDALRDSFPDPLPIVLA